jgi:hypothetical protein
MVEVSSGKKWFWKGMSSVIRSFRLLSVVYAEEHKCEPDAEYIEVLKRHKEGISTSSFPFL